MWSRSLSAAERAVSHGSGSGISMLIQRNSQKYIKNNASLLQHIPSTIFLKNFFYTPSLSCRATVKAANDSTQDSSRDTSVDLKQVLGSSDLSFLTQNIQKLIHSNHPLLNTVANYYFNTEGKKLRPLLVLLMAQASSGVHINDAGNSAAVEKSHTTLATITELIHTASLLHDDVIDGADTRRSMESVNHAYGNKMAILGGDFLLSRASVALARLGNVRVVELMAEVIGELVEGEVMQFKGGNSGKVEKEMDWSMPPVKDLFPDNEHGKIEQWHLDYFTAYLRKTYLKTASLMAKSCQSAILLHAHSNTTPESYERIAYEFGKNFGIAFQLIDDLLDFTASAEQLGKPAGGNDLKLGLATGPVLYASVEFPELRQLIDRKFSAVDRNDVVDAIESVNRSKGIEMTRRLAEWYSKQAEQFALQLPPSDARNTLVSICQSVLHRTK